MCWHGIQPGTESINEAKVHLALDPTIAELDQPYSYMISWILPNTPLEVDALHWPGTPGEEVQMIDFNFKYNRNSILFRLSDAIALWGQPVSELRYICTGADAHHAMVAVYFNGNIRVETVELYNDWMGTQPPVNLHITPSLEVASVRFSVNSYALVENSGGIWPGFKRWSFTDLGHISMCGF